MVVRLRVLAGDVYGRGQMLMVELLLVMRLCLEIALMQMVVVDIRIVAAVGRRIGEEKTAVASAGRRRHDRRPLVVMLVRIRIVQFAAGTDGGVWSSCDR